MLHRRRQPFRASLGHRSLGEGVAKRGIACGREKIKRADIKSEEATISSRLARALSDSLQLPLADFDERWHCSNAYQSDL